MTSIDILFARVEGEGVRDSGTLNSPSVNELPTTGREKAALLRDWCASQLSIAHKSSKAIAGRSRRVDQRAASTRN